LCGWDKFERLRLGDGHYNRRFAPARPAAPIQLDLAIEACGTHA
jgi:hypothetical protein